MFTVTTSFQNKSTRAVIISPAAIRASQMIWLSGCRSFRADRERGAGFQGVAPVHLSDLFEGGTHDSGGISPAAPVLLFNGSLALVGACRRGREPEERGRQREERGRHRDVGASH